MRAFYRGYSSLTGRRAGQVRRLHLYREDGRYPGQQAHCGMHGYEVTNSPPIVLDPAPAAPPEGLTWCGACVGRAAERTGQLDEFAAALHRA
ncbi:hypothetical protein [Streptomyces sp. Y1]|uniref:Uncharacterized protein n=1 Tax=Streptomyces sp. Y1 TaxID=3238634 RepID=A0AB39TJR0_9ACTN